MSAPFDLERSISDGWRALQRSLRSRYVGRKARSHSGVLAATVRTDRGLRSVGVSKGCIIPWRCSVCGQRLADCGCNRGL